MGSGFLCCSNPMASFSTMQVCFAELDAEEQDPIFLYRLVEGESPAAACLCHLVCPAGTELLTRPGGAAPSYGLHCAKLAGLRQDLLKRAQQVHNLPACALGAWLCDAKFAAALKPVAAHDTSTYGAGRCCRRRLCRAPSSA